MSNIITQFDGVYLDGATSKGRLRMASQGIGWRALQSDKKPFTVPASDLKRAYWSRVARNFELKFQLKNNTFVRIDGLEENESKDALRTLYGITLEHKEHALKGWNWGKVEFEGPEVVFNVANKPAFEVPVSKVSNTNLAGKSEIAIEFTGIEDEGKAPIGDQLVEIRLYIPGNAPKEDDDDGGSNKSDAEEEALAATVFYDNLKNKANIGEVAGDTICSFGDTMFLTPRGRYDIDAYDTSFRLRGKTYDYKIPYSYVERIFLLPRPDDKHVLCAIGLEPPLRQGQTRYPYLVAQFERDEDIEVELNIEDDVYQEKYADKLKKRYDHAAYEVFSQIFRGLSGQKVTIPSGFSSSSNQSSIKCALKANEGYLYPLDSMFFFLPKPQVLLKYRDIALCTFSRVGFSISSSKTFDMTVEMKDDQQYQFLNIARAELQKLEDYLKSRKVKCRNEMVETSKMELDDDDDDSSDDDPRGGGGSNEDEESVDEDFQASDDDGGSPPSSEDEEMPDE